MEEEAVGTEDKTLRPNERRAQTDIAFREIIAAEVDKRQRKSARLKQARVEAERRGL
jgi:hypothetical protein